ncbi:hypothetical protein [Halorussus sp. MSC15.2]|uniref:hypothetical protein n=1 Tax=Halorussus sp. MSC15.2 TaxID=2283638 RepID=UPI0013D26749|nr:hypothetical protein [Halorussus sp. MSC15.2]NEU56467.1 hypothetical protein [Halorussus sp. MSC15.2]
MKRLLSAAVDRAKRLLGSSASDTAGRDASAGDDSPDLYECEGCGTVFITEPNQCPSCEDDDFSNVGKFE